VEDCRHKLVREIDEVYIPDYSIPITTSGQGGMAKVKQWECLICGARLGYLNEDQTVIDIDCLKKR
jgi:hypothetical protein